jgi:hypothetical protein
MSSVVYPVGSVHRSRDLWEELPREDCGIFVSRLGAAKTLFIPLMFNGVLGFISWLLWELCR